MRWFLLLSSTHGDGAETEERRETEMNGNGLLKNIQVIALIIAVLVALVLIYVYPAPPADAGIDGNLRYGLDLVGGSWLQLKLEGTVAGIDAPINESEVARFLEQELNAEVYKGEDLTVYEIRKSVSKEELVSVLQEINGSLVMRADGTDYFEEGVTPETRDETKRIIEAKLNMLGLADIKPRTVGNQFILVDLAGVDIGTAKSIVGKPGKFEIRIQTNGTGGDIQKGMRFEEIENITAHVVFGSEGIESKSVGAMPVRESERSQWGAAFTLTEKGATALRDAALEYGATDNPTDHELAMLLDDVVIYSARLSDELARDLKEKPAYGLRAETGLENEGFERAKELIIHLKAGVLPVNVKIIGSGEVPAYLGAKFKEGSLIAGFAALLLVALVVFLRYRERKIVLPIFFTLLSEVILILGFAAAISWQLDLPSIAGIIAVIGTGVDQLVIISDEVISGGRSSVSMYRRRISFAFGIIFASATTTIVAMLALAFLALGTLRGFAIVTIVGLVIGIFITRPAYARIIEELL
jgi:preprotein translocase subunit SecD